MVKKKVKAKTKVAKKKIIKKVAKKASLKKAKALITKKMLLSDVAQKYPESISVMFGHGMHCIGCGMSAFETIEQGCMGHGMSDNEIDAMVSEMNKAAKKK